LLLTHQDTHARGRIRNCFVLHLCNKAYPDYSALVVSALWFLVELTRLVSYALGSLEVCDAPKYYVLAHPASTSFFDANQQHLNCQYLRHIQHGVQSDIVFLF
jgi:hypothetical protein